MILDVDIGNTRLKWRLRSGGVIARGVHDGSDISSLASQVETWGVPRRLTVSCVGKRTILENLQQQATLWGADVLVATTQKSQSGVTCGYHNPAQMGVDRWLSVIAAYHAFKGQPCVVVGCGSAITVDLVDAVGLHKGGYIVPGLYKMLDCLYQQTAQVKVAEFQLETSASAMLRPGESTEEAVSRGLFAMVHGLVSQGVGRLTENGMAPQVVMTGGDAALVAKLGIVGEIKENLVLDGLALIEW